LNPEIYQFFVALLSAKGRIRRGELRGFRFSALFASSRLVVHFVFPGHVGITAPPKKVSAASPPRASGGRLLSPPEVPTSERQPPHSPPQTGCEIFPGLKARNSLKLGIRVSVLFEDWHK
jgi:hypothetical protein